MKLSGTLREGLSCEAIWDFLKGNPISKEEKHHRH